MNRILPVLVKQQFNWTLMIDIFKDQYFIEHHETGFVDTGIFLLDDLVEEIKQHYQTVEEGRNDFPRFFVSNEHLAYVEGEEIGDLFVQSPDVATKMVKNLYDMSYSKAVYREQVFLKRVCQHLLDNGFQKFFKTRYLLVGYDMYLRSKHGQMAAGIHSDLPNFHHFYETENDLTLYIPLIDLNEENGGRLSVLPQKKLKIPSHLFLKLLLDFFSSHLDDTGYINPESISSELMDEFVQTKSFKDLLACYKMLTDLAKSQYADDFVKPDESRGKVLLWNNKDFHAADTWNNPEQDREVYIIRLFPLYDVNIKLKSKLHGNLFNNHLFDFETGEIVQFDNPVDVSQLAKQDKLAL